jgi:aspartokinase-like uncharacterized kinase
MAILAMDQYGLLLSHIISNSKCSNSLQSCVRLSNAGRIAIFLPSKLLSRFDPFKASWDVTSDSIAAHVAFKLKSKRTIFVTDVDGIFTQDPKIQPDAKLLKSIPVHDLLALNGRTSVDRHLPEFLKQYPLPECYVVNGCFPNRIKSLCSGEETVCTQILA